MIRFAWIFRGINEVLCHNSNFYLHKILILAVKRKRARAKTRATRVRNTPCVFPFFAFDWKNHQQWNFSFHFVILVFPAWFSFSFDWADGVASNRKIIYFNETTPIHSPPIKMKSEEKEMKSTHTEREREKEWERSGLKPKHQVPSNHRVEMFSRLNAFGLGRFIGHRLEWRKGSACHTPHHKS